MILSTYEQRHSATGRLIWTNYVWESRGRTYMKRISARTGRETLMREEGGVFLILNADEVDYEVELKKGEM